MALSGRFETTFTNNSQFKLILDWSATQDINSNTSSVTAILKVQSMAYGQTYSWLSKSSTIAISDNSASQYVNVNTNPNQTKELWRRTATVYHNSDGTRTFNLSASVNYTGITWNGGALGNITVGGSITLNTIPRVSTLTMSTSKVFLDDTTVSFTINKAHSSFTHDLYWSFYNQNNPGFSWVEGQWGYLGNIKKSGVTTASDIIPMTDKVLSLLSNTSTSWFYIYLDTFNGSTLVGRTWYRIDIEIPARIKPTVAITSLLESDTEVFNTMGKHEFVVSKSAPKMTAAGTAGKYATTTQYEFCDADGRYITTTSSTITFSAPKKEKNEGEFWVRCQDSRGRWSDWALIKRKIHNWEPPKIELFNIYRDKTKQEEVFVDAKGSISSLDGKNIANYWVDVLSGDEWLNKGGIAIGGSTTTINQTIKLTGNFDVRQGFSFRVNFRDKFDVSTSTFNITTAKVLLHYDKDIGIGIGKMREDGGLDVADVAYFRSGIVTPNVGFQGYLPSGDAQNRAYWQTFPNGQTSWFKTSDSGNNFPATWMMVEVVKTFDNFSVMAYDQENGGMWRLYGNEGFISGWTKLANDIEYIYNSNGYGIRFPDGAQICWADYLVSNGNLTAPHGSLYTTSNTRWTFPAAFKVKPTVSFATDGGVAWTWAALGANPVNNVYCEWIGVGAVSVSSPVQASIIAIGRWK